jgi:hypothetical protein
MLLALTMKDPRDLGTNKVQSKKPPIYHLIQSIFLRQDCCHRVVAGMDIKRHDPCLAWLSKSNCVYLGGRNKMGGAALFSHPANAQAPRLPWLVNLPRCFRFVQPYGKYAVCILVAYSGWFVLHSKLGSGLSVITTRTRPPLDLSLVRASA